MGKICINTVYNEVKHMKNTFLCICSLSIVLLFCSCTKRIDVDICNDIDEYNLNDSSSIGISLEAKFKDEPPENIEYDWHTVEGTFVIYNNNKTVKLGKRITNNGEKIYWTGDLDEEFSASANTISLKVKNLDNGKYIANDFITIKVKDGIYKVKK
jgi:hypothetical protein